MNLFRQDREKYIVGLFSKGASDAMDKLYNEYADLLAGVCERYVPDSETVKDVLQESFIKIFSQINSFEYRGKGSLKAWLTRIVINESLNQLRKEKQFQISDTNIDNLDLPDIPPDTEDLTEDEILGLIHQLPPGYRTVFNLFVIEGKSHKEIAEILNIKADSSASQFHRAKSMLANMITEYKIKKDKR